MRTICVANQKGGCGKTTTTINLAACLSWQNKRVLVIDLDPQAHATMGLGIDSNNLSKSIYNIFIDPKDTNFVQLKDIILQIRDNFSIVPSNIVLGTVEQELAGKENAVSILSNNLNTEEVKNNYDYVIIDCPPNLGFLTFNGLRASDELIIPVEPSNFSLNGVSKIKEMINLIKAMTGHKIKVYALITMYSRRTKFAQNFFENAKNYFKDELLKSVIRFTVSLKESASRGIPAIKFDRSSIGAADYLKLSDEILKMDIKQQIRDFVSSVSETVDKTKEHFFTRQFSFHAPSAKSVYIAGDFNNWTPSEEYLFTKNHQGNWTKRLTLQPGRYRYRLIIDDVWQEDPNSQEYEPNPYGGQNSILTVE